MYDTPKKRFKITSGCVLLYLLISVIVSVFFLILFIDTNTLFFDYDKVNNLSNILTILSMFLTFLFITLVFKKKLKLNLHWKSNHSLSKKQIISCFLFGLGMNIACTLLFGILSSLFHLSLTEQFEYIPHNFFSAVLFILMTVVAAPVFEEWLFRGVIMQTLKRYGRWFALVITSLLFALCHGSLSSAISVFFIGMAIGYVVMQTDSLINGILMHMANNAVALLSLYADNQIMTVLLSLLIIATGICGIVLFILALRNRSKLIRPLISPYDYPIKAYFKNWVAILTLVILGLMILSSFLSSVQNISTFNL